jgi:hypothetical protein
MICNRHSYAGSFPCPGCSRTATAEVAQGEAVEVVAHMYQHDETGRIGFVDQQQVDWGFEKNNPRLQLCGELMTVAQHNRIVAAMATPSPDAELVELLRGVIDLAGYWINRTDTRGMSKADYMSWVSLGHESKALLAAYAKLASLRN